jgi:hypothetical protein
MRGQPAITQKMASSLAVESLCACIHGDGVNTRILASVDASHALNVLCTIYDSLKDSQPTQNDVEKTLSTICSVLAFLQISQTPPPSLLNFSVSIVNMLIDGQCEYSSQLLTIVSMLVHHHPEIKVVVLLLLMKCLGSLIPAINRHL